MAELPKLGFDMAREDGEAVAADPREASSRQTSASDPAPARSNRPRLGALTRRHRAPVGAAAVGDEPGALERPWDRSVTVQQANKFLDAAVIDLTKVDAEAGPSVSGSSWSIPDPRGGLQFEGRRADEDLVTATHVDSNHDLLADPDVAEDVEADLDEADIDWLRRSGAPEWMIERAQRELLRGKS